MILFISDIHGIYDNLENFNINKYENIFFLGDLYGSLEGDEKVENFFRKYSNKIICTKGNCDYPFDYEALGYPVNEVIHFEVDGIKIYCNHGHKYRYKYLSTFEGMDVLIYGHEHIPYIKENNGNIYICVGSISKPRDENGPSYLEYDNNKFTLRKLNGEEIDSIEIKK